MPRRGGKRKKTRTHEQGPPPGANIPENNEKAEQKLVPRSIVAKASKVSQPVGELIRDMRRLMGPHTASNLREKSYNRMKDYASVAGQLGVSHLLMLSQTNLNVILRLARFPDGPTLHFRINRYSLCRHIRAVQKRPFESHAAYLTPPLVVLNNFSQAEDSHVKLMRVTFQHMFPTINIKTVRLSECRRVALFHLMEDGTVELRHFAIKAAPVGVSKSVRRILHAKIPDLSRLEDISEFIEGRAGALGGAITSDSEGEDEQSKVTLPDKFVGKGNYAAQKSAMKLSELGPRLTLELFKVEQGVNEGDVLFHKFVHKTPEEAAEIKRRVEKQRKLKEQRRSTQEANVQRKREAEEQKREQRAERKRHRLEGEEGAQQQARGGGDSDEDEDDVADYVDGDDYEEEEEEEEASLAEDEDEGSDDGN